MELSLLEEMLKSLQHTEAVPDNQKDIRPAKYKFISQRLLTLKYSYNKSLHFCNGRLLPLQQNTLFYRCNRSLIPLQQKNLAAAEASYLSCLTLTEVIIKVPNVYALLILAGMQ
jgi:hypothetical protein